MPDSAAPTHQHSFRRVPGRPAGQREDLVARLRDLAGNYPAGIGLLKEFLQNADDAGATWVRFTLDLRAHCADQRPDERMAHLFGPALLVESDQTFSEPDVANIQRIGAAGKIDDAGKTGRFGLGFNTVYSITDYPSFATRDLIMTFDPYFDTVAERGEEPGRDWSLGTLWADAPDWPRAFDLPGGLGWLDTTVFRLPLRLESQATVGRISRTPTRPEELKTILASLAEWGERLVLYLRSVVHVEARVLHVDGREESLVDVRTSNAEEVRTVRDGLLPGMGESTSSVLERASRSDTVRVYPHHFTLVAGNHTKRHSWMVCQGLFLGEEGDVLDAAEAMLKVGEKAIPLGGAAIRVELDEDGEILPIETPGTLACSLPIPQQLPMGLALNGRWSLSSSRDHVRFGADGGEEAAKIEWNRVLAEEVVPAAVVGLLAGIRDRLGSAGASGLYAALPDLRRLTAAFDQALGAGIYRALAGAPSIRVEDATSCDWRLPGEATLPPAWSAPLVDACIADDLELAVPVPPDHVLHGLAEVDEAPRALTPAEARAWLGELGGWAGPPKDAPRACLRSRDLVFELARFCSEGGRASLAGAPLAWMHDGSLRTFGQGDPICLGGEGGRSLFRSQRTWFLDAELERQGPVMAKQANGLLEMTTGLVVANLDKLLPKGRDDAWEPAGKGALNEAWLTELYLWLGALPDLKSHLDALKPLAMVPDSKGRLVRPGTTGTPLLPRAEMARSLSTALDAFGVPMASGSPKLLSAIRAFAAAAKGMVREVTPDDVTDTLPSRAASFPGPSPHRPVLLNWFAAAFEGKELSAKALALLKHVPLWPTQDGRFVAAAGDDVFLPDYQPPPGFAQVTLLQVLDAWRPLLAALGVPTLELGAWILKVFLKEYPALDAAPRARALRWLRDKGLDALTGPEDSVKKLREALRDTPLIVADDGTLQPAGRLYHPDAREAVSVLGGVVRFPDWKGAYREEAEAWGAFFTRLRLHTHPLDRDVIARVEQLLRDAPADNGDQTEAAMLDVYDFLEKRWAKSSDNEKSELARKLRDLAWVPTMRRPGHGNEVALFLPPAARFAVPAKVYPSRLLHQAASQVAFMAGGKEDSHVRQALGMPSEIPPEAALAHFRAVRDAWLATGSAGLRPEAVGRVASGFYRGIGALLAARPGNMVALNTIKASLAGSACVWDAQTKRFWKSEQVFAEGASWLGGLRGSVPTLGQEGTGLDFLGRRARPESSDLVAVLNELYTSYGASPLAAPQLEVALRCWHELAGAPELLTPDLPVPTATNRLAPAEETLVDDASYWRDRLKKADLPWLHHRIPPAMALDAGAQRASNVIEERRQSWRIDAPQNVRRLCVDRQTHLESPAFNSGLLRLLAQANPDAEAPDPEMVRRAARLDLVACGQISAGLICPRFGLEESVGVEEVACLLDNEDHPPKVWVASDEADAVALELGRALVRRLKEADIDEVDAVNEASLEAILRCRTEQVERTLDKRRVPSLVQNFEAPAYDDPDEAEGWQEEGREDGHEEGDFEDPDDDRPSDEPDAPAALVGGEGGRIPPRAPGMPASAAPGPRVAGAGLGAHAQPAVASVHARTAATSGPTGAGSGSQHGLGSDYTGAGALPPIDAPPRERKPLTDRVPAPSPAAGVGEGPRAAPTVPHLGQGGAGSRRRGQFLSYLEPRESTGAGAADPTPGRLATEEAALEYVDEVETNRGRTVTPMARSNEGYDREILVPGEAEPRIVEVKGLGGAWDARGVRLTPAELRAAHAFGERYWVYVVEFAKEPSRRRLYRLRGPASQVNAYCLDQGWAALDEPEAEALTPAGGLLLLDGDTPLGVIETTEQRGEAIKLVFVTESGERSRLTWNPSRHRLQPRST